MVSSTWKAGGRLIRIARSVLRSPGVCARGASLALVCVLLGASVAQARLIDAVIAVVDSTPVTLHELKVFKRTSARLLTPGQLDDDQAVLDALINQRLFDAEYEKSGIKASDEDVNRYIDRVFEATGTNKERTMATLKTLDLTWDDYFERMRNEVKKTQLLNREIRSRVNVTPEEVERAWRGDDSYLLPDRVEIGDIFLPAPPNADAKQLADLMATAREAHKLAAQSAKGFAQAARTYSQGPTASEGGTLGVFERGSMAQLFEDAVAGLPQGGVSPPLVSDQGVHIVRLIRQMPPGRVPLEDVRAKIREKLYEEKLQSRFRTWMDAGLRKNHYVADFYGEVLALQ